VVLSVLFVVLAVAATVGAEPLSAQSAVQTGVQDNGQVKPNYQLAARFAPYKLRELVHSTVVTPNWIEHGDRFWYQWETSDGTVYYIVDPTRGSKSQIFDNDRIAAEITRITKDPWDAQHLGIRAIKFIDDNTLQFEVQSSEDEEIEEEEVEEEEQQEQRGPPRRPRTRKKVYHFEYDVDTRTCGYWRITRRPTVTRTGLPCLPTPLWSCSRASVTSG
jgi:hypothetical protein